MTLDFLLPIVILYVCAPLSFLLGSLTEMNTIILSWICYSGSCIMAVWWVMVFFDGTIKSAIKWIFRYYLSMALAFLAFYGMVLLGLMDFFLLCSATGISILANGVMGLVTYKIRKITGNGMLVFVVILLAYLCFNPLPESLFGTAFWGLI